MQRYRNKKIHTFCNMLVIVAILLAVSLINFHRQLDKHMKQICEYKGKETVNNIVVSAIDKQLKGSECEYIIISRDNNGKILSIESDADEINKIQNEIKKQINKDLSHINNNRMSLPIGTLTGITLFSGFGPEIVLKLHQVGGVDTEIKSEFETTGINQTKYKVIIEIQVELSAVLPAHSTDIIIKDEYLIAETIIIGEIPNAYLHSNQI